MPLKLRQVGEMILLRFSWGYIRRWWSDFGNMRSWTRFHFPCFFEPFGPATDSLFREFAFPDDRFLALSTVELVLELLELLLAEVVPNFGPFWRPIVRLGSSTCSSFGSRIPFHVH